MLLTTTVGSFPKPAYLVAARSECASGRLSRQKLKGLEKEATRECIHLQEDIGLDILVHGEMERGDMVTYFAERMRGFGIGGLVRSYGNRYYRMPVVMGTVRREDAITVEMFEWAQSLTDKPVKGILTGPYTMSDWSFNEYYPDRTSLVLALAEEMHKETVDLEQAGARYIQIDEPAICTRPDEIELAIEAMRIVTQGIRAKTISHICYGDLRGIYPEILGLPVDQLDLEFSNNLLADMGIFRDTPFAKEIALGVIDVHSHFVEEKDQIKDNIGKALKVFPIDKVAISPDCGLKTRTHEEAEAKLRAMVQAVREIREELGIQ